MNADAELLALRLANEALQAQLIADAEQTERMLAELEQQRNQLRDGHREQQSLFRFVQRVMDSVGSLVVVLDAEGRIVRCNRAATEQLAGIDPACGTQVIDAWLHPDDRASVHDEVIARSVPWAVRSDLFEVVRARSGHAETYRLRVGNGSFRHFQVEGSLLYDERSKSEGAVINASDITDLKRLSEHLEDRVKQRTSELAEAIEKLAESEKLATLGGLVAGMAHEINSPIANTRVVANTLDAECADLRKSFSANAVRRSQLGAFIDKCAEACRVLDRNTQRATDMIASFKQVAVDGSSMRRRSFALSELIAETLSAIAPVFKSHPARIHVDAASDLLLDTYPGAVEQILINLITNAVRHGSIEGKDLRVDVLGHADEERPGWCKLVVADDGQGMPPNVAARAFDRFFTTKINKGGSGLGLYLVDSLASKVLGGEIAMETAPGSGTRFTLRFPILAPDAGGDSGL